MLNDKSAIREARNIYEKYSIVTDEYDDEYDDTYDSHDIRGNAQDDSAEIDARSFTTPRVSCSIILYLYNIYIMNLIFFTTHLFHIGISDIR